MKKYTVIQVADLLETNPETVRRWIRSDKLPAEQSSRKGGNVISEQSLAVFLDGSPKYASKAEAKGVVVRQAISQTAKARVSGPVQGKVYLAPTVKNTDRPRRRDIERALLPRLEYVDPPKGTVHQAYAQRNMEEVTAKLDAQQREIRELKRLLESMELQIGAMYAKGK